MATYPELRRTGITSLDEALYAASCFAANADDGSRTVTIMASVDRANREHYYIQDGEVGPSRDNVSGVDWWPVYVVKAPQRREG